MTAWVFVTNDGRVPGVGAGRALAVCSGLQARVRSLLPAIHSRASARRAPRQGSTEEDRA